MEASLQSPKFMFMEIESLGMGGGGRYYGRPVLKLWWCEIAENKSVSVLDQ